MNIILHDHRARQGVDITYLVAPFIAVRTVAGLGWQIPKYWAEHKR